MSDFDPATIFSAPSSATKGRAQHRDPWLDQHEHLGAAPAEAAHAQPTLSGVIHPTGMKAQVGRICPISLMPPAVLIAAQVAGRAFAPDLAFDIPLSLVAVAGLALIAAVYLSPARRRTQVLAGTCLTALAVTFPALTPALAALAAVALWVVRR